MHLKLSKSIFLLTFPLWLHGCRQGYDLAPVVSADQRFDGYYRDMARQNQNINLGNPSQPDIEQNNVGSNQKPIEKDQKPEKGDREKGNNEFDPIQPEIKYHVVKEGETLYSIGVRSGYGLDKLAMWNRIAPPYQIETGQKIRLFKPPSTDKAGSVKGISDTAAKNPDDSRKNNSLNSSDKLKFQKKPLSRRLKSDKNHKKNKKNSIISIDNKNMLMLDFQWPITGKIRKNFSQTDNKGIDIAGAAGQTVRASEAGKVVYSGQGLIGFGNLLIIKHNNEYLSAYANTSSLFVKEGQHVKKGQDIAKIGAAVSKKALLHFEIRKNGKSVNPLSLLPKND